MVDLNTSSDNAYRHMEFVLKAADEMGIAIIFFLKSLRVMKIKCFLLTINKYFRVSDPARGPPVGSLLPNT